MAMSQYRPSAGLNFRTSSVGGNFRLSGTFGARAGASDPQMIAQALCRFFPQLQVTVNDILEPTCEKMCEVYQCIAEKVMRIPPTTFSMPPLTAAPNTGYDSDLFGAVLPKIVIFRAMSALLEDISDSPNGPDFGMNDLISPNPKSTRLFLTTLVDFLEFSEKANKEVEYAFALHDEKKTELHHMEHDILKKTSDLEKLRANANNKKRIANEIREQLDQANRNTQAVYTETEAMQEKYRAEDVLVTELKTKIESSREEMTTLTAHNELLKSKIVHSPERLENEVASLEEQSRVLKERVDVKRRELSDQQDKKRSKATAGKAIEQLKKEIKSIGVFKSDVIEKEELISAAEEIVRKVMAELQTADDLIKREEERAAVSDLAFQRSYEQHKQDLANIREQLSVMENTANGLRSRMEKINNEKGYVQSEIGKVRDEMATCVRAVEARTNRLVDWLHTVIRQVNEEKMLYEQEGNCFTEVVSITENALHGEMVENSDTFTISPKKKQMSIGQ